MRERGELFWLRAIASQQIIGNKHLNSTPPWNPTRGLHSALIKQNIKTPASVVHVLLTKIGLFVVFSQSGLLKKTHTDVTYLSFVVISVGHAHIQFTAALPSFPSCVIEGFPNSALYRSMEPEEYSGARPQLGSHVAHLVVTQFLIGIFIIFKYIALPTPLHAWTNGG